MQLTELKKAMNKAVEDIGGMQASIDACDRMYDATFRSEACLLSDESEGDYDYASLKSELAIHLYTSKTGNRPPSRPDISYSDNFNDDDSDYDYIDDYEMDSYYASIEAFNELAEEWFTAKYPDFKITGDTLVVYFCNYKGEGEGGLGLHSLHKHLPVFLSKSESFNAVN